MSSDIHNKVILLADDERSIVEMLFDMLQLTGYHCYTAYDGHAALEAFKANQNKIDLVILDIFMPFMSGIEVYKEIYKINPDMKFLFISGYTDKKEIKQFLEKQNLPFINKPFNFNTLLTHIKEIFS